MMIPIISKHYSNSNMSRRNKAESDPDFFSWDGDLDLDDLLGDYTDDDVLSGNRENREQCSSVEYVCPSCNKEYKTISGFRGHVTKKHQLQLKASDYRKGANAEQDNQDEGAVDQATNAKSTNEKTPWIPSDMYPHIFDQAYTLSLQGIQKSPIHNMFGRSTISQIAEFCESSESFKQNLQEIFKKIANEPVNILATADRENLFSKFHELRLSSDMKTLQTVLLAENCPCPDDIDNFLQIHLLELTTGVLVALAQTMKRKELQEAKELSKEEQKVLFYVSGYLIHALRKKYMKRKDAEVYVAVVDTLIAKENAPFLKEFSTMLEKADRGGLKNPCDNMYYLVRAMENVVRANTDNKLTQDSLNKSRLTESIIEDFNVKHYTRKLFQLDNEEELSEGKSVETLSIYLEDIIHLFLTVRGFAAAKLERKRIAASKNTSKTEGKKAGSSFRDALKEKCLNI